MRMTALRATSTVVGAVLLLLGGFVADFRNRSARAVRDSIDRGAQQFRRKGCSTCHDTESTEFGFGPGLQGLFERDKMPKSGRPVSEAAVRRQLREPYDAMPSFKEKLTDEELEDLVAYLKTL